jgi:hypothetical protein
MTFDEAKRRFPHRFTCEHVPTWAHVPFLHSTLGAVYYAPQYHDDWEWYEATTFPGESGLHGNSKHCNSGNPSWPLGRGFLREPFHLNRNQSAVLA